MKKLLYLFLVLSLLSACSEDGITDAEDTIDPSSPENLLPKRITGRIGDESLSTYDFYYDENKIIEIKGENHTIKVTYRNNLITNVSTYYDKNSTVSKLWQTFSYDTNGRIKKVTGTREGEFDAAVLYDFIDTIEYASNGDFTVTSEDQNGA
jgi:hypothetical protein